MKYQDMMRESLEYMNKHKKEETHMRDLAEQFFYNPDYFGYLFSAFFEVTAFEYIKKTKEPIIEYSKKMPFERQIPYYLIREEYVRREAFTVAGENISFDDVCGEEIFDRTAVKFSGLSFGEDRDRNQEAKEVIALWWHDDQCKFYYTVGSETEREQDGLVTIPDADYVVLFTGRDSDEDDLVETQKILVKYALSEWEKSTEYSIDGTKIYFIRYYKGKVFLYLPIIENSDQEEESELEKEKKKKIYGVDTWTTYIDEHIKENLTPQGLAKIFHYSYQHFRYVFRMYYDMSVADYIRKRKLAIAADEIIEGRRPVNIAEDYGFQSYQGFMRAFKKEFGVLPGKYSKAQFEVIDLAHYYSQYRNRLKISYVFIEELKMIGHTVLIGHGTEMDIPAQVTYWLDRDFPCMMNTRFACNKERHEDKIALWYHLPEKPDIEYVLGPVVDDFEGAPDNMLKITVGGGKYAIFETEKEDDRDDLSETIRMFARCVLYGWVKEYRERIDFNRLTFERYVDNKVYQYVPILDE